MGCFWLLVIKTDLNEKTESFDSVFFGADDEARTRYLHLGKVALYQMSYIRNCKRDYSKDSANCQALFLIFCVKKFGKSI